MKISLNDILCAAQAPLSGPLPLVERTDDQGYNAVGFPRAAADLRVASDWFFTAAIKGAITSPLAAAGVAKLVWYTPGVSLLALPASAVGALAGTGLAALGAIYSSGRGTMLAVDAGGNVVYGAGEALIGAGQQLSEVLQRQVADGRHRRAPAVGAADAPAGNALGASAGRVAVDAEAVKRALAHPLSAPLDLIPAGKAHRYGSLNLFDRSVRLAGNAACTAAIRSATPFVAAFGTGKEFYNRGGVSTLLSPVAAMAGFAVGAAWGTAGAIVNGGQVVAGIAGAQVGAAGAVAELTLDGMGLLTLPEPQGGRAQPPPGAAH